MGFLGWDTGFGVDLVGGGIISLNRQGGPLTLYWGPKRVPNLEN